MGARETEWRARRVPLAFLSHLKLAFPSLSNACHAGDKRLEVEGERENGRARPFFLVPTISMCLLRRLACLIRNRTNTQGLSSDWEMKVLPLPCKWLDLRFTRMTVKPTCAHPVLRMNFVFGLHGKLSKAGTLELSNAPSSIEAFLMYFFVSVDVCLRYNAILSLLLSCYK